MSHSTLKNTWHGSQNGNVSGGFIITIKHPSPGSFIMGLKKCTKCGKIKDSSLFKHKICKQCIYKHRKNWGLTHKGIAYTTYSTQKRNSKLRNHPLPSYTKEELYKWLISQDRFESLYDEWVKSNYDRWIKPSVDRINDYKPYTINNIQLTTWGENNIRAHMDVINGINNKQNTSIDQYSITGEYIETFHSIHDAGRKTNTYYQNISKVCRGLRNSAGGYIWKYKL